MQTEPITLTARWLFPVDQPPLARGTITLKGDCIESVDRAGTRTPDLDLGNVAILPGFVNAHTHLDLSDALGKCPPSPDFTGWLRLVIAHRRRQTPADVVAALDVGLAQCLRYGTTLVGDISAGGASWEKLLAAPLRAVLFFELLGLGEQRAKESFERAVQWLQAHPATDKCAQGLSPHAPYSANARLFRQAAGSANTLKVAIHLAESAEEALLLEERTGPFVPFLSDLGAWEPAGLVRNLQEILDHQHGALFIHGNYLSPATKLPGSLVTCPRTHAAFGHPPHPFRQFLANHTAVALGTDSLASNPDLDVLAEMRFVHEKFPDLSGADLLRMATLTGATALGFEARTGSLAQGKSADLIVLPLPNDESADPHRLVLESAEPLKAVVFRGSLSYSTDLDPPFLDGPGSLTALQGS